MSTIKPSQFPVTTTVTSGARWIWFDAGDGLGLRAISTADLAEIIGDEIAADFVSGPATSVDGHPAVFSGTTGKIIRASTPTGTGNPVLHTSPALVTPALGTPSSMVATNVTGTAAGLVAGNATKLATPRTINGVNFDGSANITVTASAATLTGITAVANGGTGVATLADGGVLIGDGTAGINATGTGIDGQVLTSNGPGIDPTFEYIAQKNVGLGGVGPTKIFTMPTGARLVRIILAPSVAVSITIGSTSGGFDVVGQTAIVPGRNEPSIGNLYPAELWMTQTAVSTTQICIVYQITGITATGSGDATGTLEVVGGVEADAMATQVIGTTDQVAALSLTNSQYGAGITRTGNNVVVTTPGHINILAKIQAECLITGAILTCWWTRDGVAIPNSAARWKAVAVGDETVIGMGIYASSNATALAPTNIALHVTSSIASGVQLKTVAASGFMPDVPAIIISATISN